MMFAPIKHQPELVMSRICDGNCIYANVAAMAFLIGKSHDEAGLSGVAQPLFDMLDPLYAGTISRDDITTRIGELFLDDGGRDTAMRGMFLYALDVDVLADGRLTELSKERRRQFVQMTFDLAQQGLFAPSIWTEHFLKSNVAAE